MLKKILIFLFCLEFVSLTILFMLRLYNFSYQKIFNKEPLIIFFSKNHLPHPILRKSIFSNEINNVKALNFDPNTVLYNHKFDRFGNEKKINLLKKENRNYNIFLIGGSTVEGDGVYSQEDLIDSSIRRKIDALKCLNKINIYNEGVSGNSSKQDYLNITLRILPHYSPNMIISLQGVNDFLGYTGTRNNEVAPLAKFWTTREQKTYSYINSLNFESDLLLFLKDKTYLGILLFSLIETYKNYYVYDLYYKTELSKSEDLEVLTNNYFYFQEQSYKISKLNNVLYFHFFQPVLIYKKFPTEYEKNILDGKKNTYRFDGENNKVFHSKYWENLRSFYEAIINDEQFKEKNWKTDFSGIFKNSIDLDFIDHVHYTKVAQEKIGKLIFENIKENIKCNK
jgi:hypothetical protein